jgi:hypothetical protein
MSAERIRVRRPERDGFAAGASGLEGPGGLFKASIALLGRGRSSD